MSGYASAPLLFRQRRVERYDLRSAPVSHRGARYPPATCTASVDHRLFKDTNARHPHRGRMQIAGMSTAPAYHNLHRRRTTITTGGNEALAGRQRGPGRRAHDQRQLRATSPPSRRRAGAGDVDQRGRSVLRELARTRSVAVAAGIGVGHRHRLSRRPSAANSPPSDRSQPSAPRGRAGGHRRRLTATPGHGAGAPALTPQATSPTERRQRRRRPAPGPRRTAPTPHGRAQQRLRRPAARDGKRNGHHRDERPGRSRRSSPELGFAEVAQRPLVQRRGQPLGEHLDPSRSRRTPDAPRGRRRSSRRPPWSARRPPPARCATR